MMINCLGGWVGLYVWRHYVIKSNNNLYFVKFLVAIDCRLSSPWQKCKFLVYFVCICWALFLLSMFLSFITWQLWISRWLLALAVALALDSFGFDCLYFAFDAYACLSIFLFFWLPVAKLLGVAFLLPSWHIKSSGELNRKQTPLWTHSNVLKWVKGV